MPTTVIPMFEVEVKVSGPGGCFSYEMETIRRALEAAGCRVSVVDDHPSKLSWSEMQALYNRNREPTAIRLVANHNPWGG